MTAQDIIKHCPTITKITEEHIELAHSKIHVYVKPKVRANRTRKYIQRFIDVNKAVFSKIDVVVHSS